MSEFIHDDFLLASRTASHLYHTFARDEPILDYHNHLPPQDVATDRRFANLFEIWLEGDHYKWRAMRANGEAERLVTGDADPKEKFLAYARTVPHTLRNPLYHWTHLELKRTFGIDTLLSESTADEIWEAANAQLADPSMSAVSLCEQFKVRVLCTTDDPADSLEHHAAHRAKGASENASRVRMFPTFRPDKVLTSDDAPTWNAWVDRLAAVADTDIASLADLESALRQRHDFFETLGCRLQDHGMAKLPAAFRSAAELAALFDKVRGGTSLDPTESEALSTHFMLLFGRWAAEKNWTMQLHIGPIRNNSRRLFHQLGPDLGTDSMDDLPQARSMSAFFGELDRDDRLPKTVVYNLNPSNNYLFATMVGNFQGGIPGKMQFGSGWWFLDQKEGMEWQINALSNLGLLSRFIGMLTDSRSFMSFPRHEYFRRTLCNLIGADVEAGLIPEDEDLVGSMIRNICYRNAEQYLDFEGDETA